MGDFSSEVRSLLEGGTWTNHGAQPPIMEFNIKNMRENPQLGIGLRPKPAKKDQTYTKKIIREVQSGDIIIWTQTRTDRDNIEQDVYDILHAADDLNMIVNSLPSNYLDWFTLTITLERTSPKSSFIYSYGGRNIVIGIPFTIKDNGNILVKIDANTGIPNDGDVLVWNAINGSLEYVANDPYVHTHDGDTLQLDGINSNGGAFSFTTSGQVTFSQYLQTTHIGVDRAPTAGHNLIIAEIYATTGTVVGLGCFPQFDPTASVVNNIVSIQGNVWFNTTNWAAGSAVRGLDFFPAPAASGIGSANLNITGITTGGMLNIATRTVTADTVQGMAVVPIAGIFGTDNTTANIVRGIIVSSATSTTGTWGRLTGIQLDKQSSGVINQGLWLADDGIGADLVFGAGSDANIYYNGTDLIIDPKLAGTGAVHILGDLIFTGEDTGLPFGEIWVINNIVTMSVSNAGFTQVVVFDTNGQSNNSTPDHTNDHITIGEAGKYLITVSLSAANSAGVGHIIDVHVSINNDGTVFNNLHSHRTLGTGSEVATIAISGIVDLAINDTVEVWISSDSGAARNITVEDATLTVIEVGGT